MAEYASGNDEAFEVLYRRAAPKLRSWLLKLTRDPNRAEDLVQVTFLKVHRARHRYMAGSPLLPWLHVIAKRSMLDEQRPLSQHFEVLSTDGMLGELGGSVETNAEDIAALRAVFGQLPPQYRDAIELTKFGGMSGPEAASTLNTTAAAIKQRVHRGYSLMRTWLQPLTEPASGEVAAVA